MKTLEAFRLIPWILFLMTTSCTLAQQKTNPCNEAATEHYSAVEINNVLCGYAIDRECLITEDGQEVLYQTGEVLLRLTLLGQGVDVRFNIQFRLDPISGRWFYNNTVIDNGGAMVQSSTEIRGDTAFFRTNQGITEKKVPLPPGTELETSISYPHLFRDFIKGGKTDSVYRVYDFMSGEITDKQYISKGEDDLLLNDSVYHSLVVEETNMSKGIKVTIWLEAATGLPLKHLVAGRNIYLTDKSVVGRITKVNYDNVIFARVNNLIPDFQHLSYMKVSATTESAGEVITVESLNRMGQKFTGTVTDNLVEGIFELEPARYEGAGAPPFPPDFSQDEELKKYLEPERLIESGERALIEEARRITEGSEDSWEAAKRLSKWVSENIEGAIPGGTSATGQFRAARLE